MVTIGVILLILGFVLGIPVLWTLGMIFFIIGIVLWVMGSVGREIGGRRHYY